MHTVNFDVVCALSAQVEPLLTQRDSLAEELDTAREVAERCGDVADGLHVPTSRLALPALEKLRASAAAVEAVLRRVAIPTDEAIQGLEDRLEGVRDQVQELTWQICEAVTGWERSEIVDLPDGRSMHVRTAVVHRAEELAHDWAPHRLVLGVSGRLMLGTNKRGAKDENLWFPLPVPPNLPLAPSVAAQ